MAIEVGNTVKLVQPVIQGPVLDIQYDKATKSLSMLVEYADEAGDIHSRWFAEPTLEVVA